MAFLGLALFGVLVVGIVYGKESSSTVVPLSAECGASHGTEIVCVTNSPDNVDVGGVVNNAAQLSYLDPSEQCFKRPLRALSRGKQSVGILPVACKWRNHRERFGPVDSAVHRNDPAGAGSDVSNKESTAYGFGRLGMKHCINVVYRHVSNDEAWAIRKNKRLSGEFSCPHRGCIGLAREREHSLAGFGELLVSTHGLPHLFDRFPYEFAVVAEDLGLPKQRTKLETAYYNQASGEASEPPCKPGQLPSKQGKLPVYLQILIGVGGGFLIFNKGADLVLSRHRVSPGRLLMVTGLLFFISGLGAVFFGNWWAFWRQLGL